MLIAVIDSDCFVLGSIEKLCRSKFPRHSMVGIRSGHIAVNRFRRHPPDLVVLELNLRDGDGLAIVPAIRHANPRARILGFSASCDLFTAYRVRRAGLDGYLCKVATGPDELAEVMRRMLAGERCFDHYIAKTMARVQYDSAGFTKLLSERELEFLGAIGTGMSNRDLAAHFKVRTCTANNHRAAIMAKLSIRRTRELMRFAFENGLTRVRTDITVSKLAPVVG